LTRRLGVSFHQDGAECRNPVFKLPSIIIVQEGVARQHVLQGGRLFEVLGRLEDRGIGLALLDVAQLEHLAFRVSPAGQVSADRMTNTWW